MRQVRVRAKSPFHTGDLMATSDSIAVSRKTVAHPPLCARAKHASQEFDSSVVAASSPRTRSRLVEDISVGTGIGDAIAAGLTVFEQCGIGFLVCDEHCRVVGANGVGREILRREDGLRIDQDHVLSATQDGPAKLAEAILCATVSAGSSGRFRRAVLVSRPQRKRPLTVIVQSTEGSRSTNPHSLLAVLLIMDATLAPEVSADEFRQMYGFTTVEAGLANLLMEGRSLGESCDRLDIRRSTGCSHLKRMFKKTGVHRQSHLVALLLKSVGLLRCGRTTGTINSQFGLT